MQHDDWICKTIPDKVHPYYQADVENRTDYYRKFVQNKKGGAIEENQYHKYDFDVQKDKIFLGNKERCTFVLIEGKIAQIQSFNYHRTCPVNSYLESGRGTRHMFLWIIICILKHFSKVRRIELGDDTKINCDGKRKYLAKYYFMKYGKQYYEYYFAFLPQFPSEKYKEKYEENLQKRKTAIITLKNIKKFYKEYLEINGMSYNGELLKKFTCAFGNRDKMRIVRFYRKSGKEVQIEYCDFFFYLTDKIFKKKFNEYLGQTFAIDIPKNKKKIIKNIRIHIETIIYA